MSYIDKARQNKIDREELSAYRAQNSNDQINAAAESARSDGANSAYLDIMQQLEASNVYTPIAEGSPEDIMMQQNIDRGINYKPEQDPSIVDDILGQLGKASSGVSDWFTQGAEPERENYRSDLQKSQESEQMRYESEQAGLAELEQLLNKQQQ